jgi:hypothetical protein
MTVTLGTHAVKVRLKNARRWDFVTPDGGTTHLRIHAATMARERAREVAGHMVELNPGVVMEAKVVAL